jgi:amino acid transporter
MPGQQKAPVILPIPLHQLVADAKIAQMHEQSPPRLLRALGPLTASAVVIGTVIGSGIFKKPQSIAENVPDFTQVAVVWVLGGVLALLGALALAEVAVLFPKAGGNYVFLREGYGRLAGFLWGWVEFWIIRGASMAALATIFTESLHDILRGGPAQSPVISFWERQLLTVGVILILAMVNVRGVRWGGGLQFFITLVKVGSLLGIMVLPFLLWGRRDDDPVPEAATLTSTVSFTWGGLATAFLGVLWAYHGWMNLAPVGEEVRDPQRNIPLAFLFGVGTVIFLYLGVNVAYHLIIPQTEMAGLKDTTVATSFCERLLGPIGALVASAAVMCSVFGALNGNLLVGPRLLYAMGQDGLAPRSLSTIHPSYRTPALAIVVMGGWSALLVLLVAAVSRFRLLHLELGSWELDLNPPADKSLFDILTDFTMFGAVIFETLAVTTIFVFRRRLPDADRPYRCWGYPVVPALYLILPAFVLGNMFVNQQIEAAVGVGFVVVGAAVYAVFGRRSGRESTVGR